MAGTISIKTVKASTVKHKYKPPPRDKTFGIDPYIYFYIIEYIDKPEEVEEA